MPTQTLDAFRVNQLSTNQKADKSYTFKGNFLQYSRLSNPPKTIVCLKREACAHFNTPALTDDTLREKSYLHNAVGNVHGLGFTLASSQKPHEAVGVPEASPDKDGARHRQGGRVRIARADMGHWLR